MDFKDFGTVSDDVKKQIAGVVDAWRSRLGDSLVGAYLHGSMALGRFMEGVSDIDLLFAVSRRIPRDERLLLAGDMIALDYKPTTIEMSALYTGDLSPWQYPTPCQFHYSNGWTERYRDMISGKTPESFIIDTDFTDADIACHARLTLESGICLYGAPAAQVLPQVPEEDFVASLMYDFDGNDLADESPAQLANGVLSLARVLSYLVERRIMSKYDAALWAMPRVPASAADILVCATDTKYAQKPWKPRASEELRAYREYFINQIRAIS